MADAELIETHREIFVQILEKYKSFQCLWDKTCPEYANREIRKQCYDELLLRYKKIDKTATVEKLKNKLENMSSFKLKNNSFLGIFLSHRYLALPIGRHLYSTLQQFMTLFSELRSAPLVIAGQGYAAKHVTSLAIQIHWHKQNKEANMNLMALMIGSSLMNPGAELGHSEFARRTGLVDSRVANRMQFVELRAKASLGVGDIGKAHSHYLDILGMLKDAGVFNMHNILSDELPAEDLSWSVHLQTWLKELLHVGNVTYPQYDMVRTKLLPDFMNHTQGWLEELLDHYRVLFYSGQLDGLVPHSPLEKFYHSLRWSDSDMFHGAKRRPWYHQGQLAGYHKSGGKLTTVMVRGAGHQVPTDQRERTLALVSAFIRGGSLDVDTGQ